MILKRISFFDFLLSKKGEAVNFRPTTPSPGLSSLATGQPAVAMWPFLSASGQKGEFMLDVGI